MAMILGMCIWEGSLIHHIMNILFISSGMRQVIGLSFVQEKCSLSSGDMDK